MSTIYGMTVTFGGGSVSDELVPQITVNAPTGSTVTVTKGDVTLTATESSGVWVFDLPEFGTWVVTATNGTKTVTETIVMDSTRAVSLSYFSATIAVTYPSGSTCTCSNGTTTLIAPDTTGSCTFVITGAGAWTVACTDGESYVAKSVSISADGQAATCTLEYPSADPVVLWKNAKPTSQFAAQSVSVSGTGYTYFIVEFCLSTSDTSSKRSIIVEPGDGGGVYFYYYNPVTREVTGSTSTSVTFGSGQYASSSQNYYAIPTRILGAKFTL